MSDNSTKALDKTQESMIAVISPLEKTSIELLAKAKEQNINNEQQLASAVAVKKQITAHRKLVQDTRLGITRQFDEVKKAIINKENEILLPLDEAQADLGEKMLTYQENLERIRREEEERLDKLMARFTVDVYRYKAVDDVQDEGERLKKVYSELPEADQKNAQVKAIFTNSINKLADRKAYLIEQEAQEKERARLAAEAAKQSEERQKLEAEKAKNAEKARKIEAEKERLEREKQRKADEEAAEAERKKRESAEKQQVKTGMRTVTKFEIEYPTLVPREYCAPVDALIRAAIAEGKEVAGVRVWTEKRI